MRTAKQSIIEAFLQLINEKSFQDLSVKEIVQKAQISRSTFYLHFTDKFELIDDVRRTLNERFLSFYTQDSFISDKPITTYNICGHVFKYRSFYEIEFDDADEIRKLSNQLATHLLKAFGDQDYAIFASYGTIGYLSFWVRDGFIISPGEAAEKLLKIGFTDWTSDLKKNLDRKKLIENGK
ncbi:TetR/AcrR family transcriptional regulator [Paenibacillus endoradicis]|uniref:TetR/AcrR family transcriptional regulator n=1 Tax=Paenibacillus endoradicis TaxID=2972487 RepID=UPI0021595566|nr:TetR/AcrR family transcriptional regulator [Paenibacillus endoradicis]MCR8658620.1 TetR/AcrR family transcriptional regulator [Paenibacillus endoradicis]